jgi:hypothetical protein
MNTFTGLRFRRSILTLSSATLSSGGKRLPFLCMIGLYYVGYVSQASWQIASSLKINPRSYLFQFPILYLLALLTGKVLRRSNFEVGGSKPTRNIIVFELFLFDKDSCYCIVLRISSKKILSLELKRFRKIVQLKEEAKFGFGHLSGTSHCDI